jgi:16S rRNA (cytidine1402-2'-O)-methyltransferase
LDTQENNISVPNIQTDEKTGKLFLVSVPIGNDNDISQRAIDTLKSVDLVLCEEYKEAKKILRLIGIDKPLLALNEHTEKLETESIISSLQSGQNVALISDHGTPLLEDPGKIVVKEAISKNIRITTVPGASSIISALILSGFDTKKFMYCGLLPVHKEERRQELNSLKNIQYTTIFLDTPYRLTGLLESVMQVMGNGREVSLSIDITMETEKIFRGKICDVIDSVQKAGIKKSEFVLVIKGSDNGRKQTKQNSKSFRY